MRKTIYISDRYDKDLLQYMQDNDFDKDFSYEVKKLMRDGIKYREGGQYVNANPPPVVQEFIPQHRQSHSESGTITSPEIVKTKINFSDIKLKKKEYSMSELDSKLDNL